MALFRIFTCEASLGASCLGSKDLVYAAKTTVGEPLVIVLVPGGGAGEHDVVPILAARDAVGVALGVVGGPEVVAHLVRHGHVGHGGGHVLAVVHQRDDSGVQTFVTASVVLE